MTVAPAREIPLVDYLVLGEQEPHLRAHACEACAALFFDRRNACARCGATTFARRRLQTTGTVRTFTIIHRAAPNVRVPFISIVVDLDGGGVVKANLVDTEPMPQNVPPGLRVQLTTFRSATDDDGTVAVAFAFRPQKEQP